MPSPTPPHHGADGARRRPGRRRRAGRPAVRGDGAGSLPSLYTADRAGLSGEDRAGPSAASRAVHIAAVAAVTVVGCVTAATGLPVFGHGWQPAALIAGGGVAAALVYVAGVAGRRVSVRQRRVGAAVAAAIVVLFTWGAATQVVVNGRPYPATSDVARAYKLTEALEADLYRMAELDVLLANDLVAARANIVEYEPAQQELAAIAARWANTEVASLPDGRFAPIVRSVATGADFGAQALGRKRELAVQYDARTEAEMRLHGPIVGNRLDHGPIHQQNCTILNQGSSI